MARQMRCQEADFLLDDSHRSCHLPHLCCRLHKNLPSLFDNPREFYPTDHTNIKLRRQEQNGQRQQSEPMAIEYYSQA